MDKKIIGFLGLACVACCAGPLLAIIGISSVSLASFTNGPLLYYVLGAVGVAGVGFLIFKNQISRSCRTEAACAVNCNCKPKQ